jgi:hypothetical protein
MGEIWIPQLIIIIFLLLSIVQPFFKNLRPLDGLVWLPVIGFFLTLCLFPAYGFRPECIPLLFFTFLLNIVNIPLLTASAVSNSDEKSYERGFVLPIIALVLLIAVIVPLFAFAPKTPLGLLAEGVQTRTIHNKAANYDYFIRIYSPQNEKTGNRPVVFLAPPEAGSVSATDRICAELRDQGFIVITYSRRGLDFPSVRDERKYYVSPVRISMMWRAFRHGTGRTKANNAGKFLESERSKDIEFLLPLMCRNRDENGAAVIPGLNADAAVPVFFVGYGAAGSAAAFLFEQPGFSFLCATVRGMAAIESRLWSSYQADTPREMKAQWLPQPDIPVLYLVSDNIFAGTGANSPRKNRAQSYRAVLEAFRHSTGQAALAAFEGAGPFAYCDFALTRPAYLFLYPGQKKNAHPGGEPVRDTAGYIGNFFLSLLNSADAAQPEQPLDPDNSSLDQEWNIPMILPEKREISSAVLAERKGLSGF